MKYTQEDLRKFSNGSHDLCDELWDIGEAMDRGGTETAFNHNNVVQKLKDVIRHLSRELIGLKEVEKPTKEDPIIIVSGLKQTSEIGPHRFEGYTEDGKLVSIELLIDEVSVYLDGLKIYEKDISTNERYDIQEFDEMDQVYQHLEDACVKIAK